MSNPIFLLGDAVFPLDSFRSFLSVSIMAMVFPSCISRRSSSSFSFTANFVFVSIMSLILTKALTTVTLTRTALLDFKMEAAIIAPCSVKTYGSFLTPPRPSLDITFCDIKVVNSCFNSIYFSKVRIKHYLVPPDEKYSIFNPLNWYQRIAIVHCVSFRFLLSAYLSDDIFCASCSGLI